MVVYQLAKKLGVTTKEMIKMLDGAVDHHCDKVPAELEAKFLASPEPEPEIEQEAVVKAPEPPVKEETTPEPTDVCPIDLETLALSLRGCGAKSPYWKYRSLLNG